jgi:hypothetical protein
MPIRIILRQFLERAQKFVDSLATDGHGMVYLIG